MSNNVCSEDDKITSIKLRNYLPKQGWASINALIEMAIEYLHQNRITRVYENLFLAKEALDELVSMENCEIGWAGKSYHKSK